MNDDLDTRDKQLAKELREALDREALERFYAQTGRRPAPGESETLVAVWDYASRPEAMFAIGVLTAEGVARYEYKEIPKRNRPATLAAMRRGGVPIAACYASADFVWLADAGGFRVWSWEAGLVAEATADEVLLAGARAPRG